MSQVESVETLLVAGGQSWTSNRYMDNFRGRSVRTFLKSRTASPIHGAQEAERGNTRQVLFLTKYRPGFSGRSYPIRIAFLQAQFLSHIYKTLKCKHVMISYFVD